MLRVHPLEHNLYRLRFIINRIQGKYMLENKKLSDREIMYQFLRRIPISRSYDSLRYREL